MNRRTYKALRRTIIASKLSELADGLYGLRQLQDEQLAMEDLLNNEIIYTPEDEEE
jgi:hypothetical protein